jgi:C1A family cysteine protease
MYHHPHHHHLHGKTIHLGGWKRDLPDHRDLMLSPSSLKALPLPESLVPSHRTPEFQIRVRDQESVGSCTAHGSNYLYTQLAARQNKGALELSTLYTYYFTRVNYEHVDPTEDSGASVRNAIKCLAQFGSCHEDQWPYDPNPDERYSSRPNSGAIRSAHQHMVLRYLRVTSLTQLKQVMMQDYPVAGGFTCFESLDSPQVGKTGIVPFPGPSEAVIGGHCVAFVGFDDVKKLVRFRNSWGPSWGDKGDGCLPYSYFDSGLADDLWIVTAEMT